MLPVPNKKPSENMLGFTAEAERAKQDHIIQKQILFKPSEIDDEVVEET